MFPIFVCVVTVSIASAVPIPPHNCEALGNSWKQRGLPSLLYRLKNLL